MRPTRKRMIRTGLQKQLVEYLETMWDIDGITGEHVIPEMFKKIYGEDKKHKQGNTLQARGRPALPRSILRSFQILEQLMDGKSEREVAKIFHCSRSVVRKREDWAINKIREKYPRAFNSDGIPHFKKLRRK